MADLVSQRTLTFGSKRGSQLHTWIWCVLTKCLISCSCISSKYLGSNEIPLLYPAETAYIRYGEPLEIFCVVENSTSGDIQFNYNGKHLDSEIVNGTTRKLYIELPVKQIATYYCKNVKNNKIGFKTVIVESPPADVTDFSCLSTNLESLNCSWTMVGSFVPLQYNLTVLLNSHHYPCLMQNAHSTMFCLWGFGTEIYQLPIYRQQERELHFYLVGCNAFGCNRQNFSINHFSIVKPDKPYDLKITEYSPHSVKLAWSIPNTIYELLNCGIEHKIEYQITKVDNRAYFREVNNLHLPLNMKRYKYVLDLPYAYTQYHVRISIKSKAAPKDRPLWSESVNEEFATTGKIPSRPPNMTAGAFEQSVGVNDRVIYVYWKPLEDLEYSGANFTYKIIVSQGNTTQIVHPDKNKGMHYVELKATFDAMEIAVWSVNEIGASLNSSHMHIPQEKDTRFLTVPSLTNVAYENGTYQLSWIGIDNVDNYTLFLCQMSTTQICTDRIDFVVLDASTTSHIIHLPSDHNYGFAISANSGFKSSGMAWAKYSTSKGRFTIQQFEVHLKYDALTNSSVTLRWSPVPTSIDITGYVIYYSPLVCATTCEETLPNESILILDPKQTALLIENLLPSTTYHFTIALRTSYGDKKIQNTELTTLEGCPTSPLNVQISDVKNDSLVISWDPPLHRNGLIVSYVIWNYNEVMHIEKVWKYDTFRLQVILLNIEPSTNYSISVQACNSLCSERQSNERIFVRTGIGHPGKVKDATITNNPDTLRWEPPEMLLGTGFYEVRRVRGDLEPEIIKTYELSLVLTLCEGGVSSETYEIRSVNLATDPFHGALGGANVTLSNRLTNDSQYAYPGQWSHPIVTDCKYHSSLTMIWVFTGLLTVALIGILFVSIKIYIKTIYQCLQSCLWCKSR